MKIKSRFRKLFWIRIGIGLFMFLTILSFFINGLRDPDETTEQSLVLAFVVLCFLVYVSIDVLKVFSLNIEENGIEKTSLLFRTKHSFTFDSVLSIERQKTIQRNTRGVNISDGYHISVLKFKTGKSLIISPDSFENYEELMFAIKSNLE
jgi:hypothetical protein